MPVYRGDQAQLTFAAEAAQGGDPEMMECNGAVSGAYGTIVGVVLAGARSINIEGGNGTFIIGDFVRIGFNLDSETASSSAAFREHEVRRIEAMTLSGGNATNTFTLDRPLAFYHEDGDNVREVSGAGSGAAVNEDKNKFITFIPGVYESVDAPDPVMSITGRRFLNTTSKRNYTVPYAGSQTLTGSVSGIILLNGWPLRFPIGKVVTTPSALSSAGTALGAAAKKGDVFIDMDTNQSLIVKGDYINIDDGSSTVSEVRRVIVDDSVLTGDMFKLDHPLQFDHLSGASVEKVTIATSYFTHTITEQTELDTVTWNLHMPETSATAGKVFNRRYVGGMIGSSTISAEEGGMVTMSWDGVNFLNMLHNQQSQTDVGASSGNMYYGASITANMPRYALMQQIDENDVGKGKSTIDAANTAQFPANQPYYFSEGTMKFFGTEFARIRSFSISISNGEEPRYYLGKQGARMRGPYEIKEGPRNYTMSCTVVLPDALALANEAYNSTRNAAQDSALELFRQLLLEGDYGTTTTDHNMKGFSSTIKFERGTNDSITISIPPDGSSSTTFNDQGLFINTANLSPGADSLLQVDLDMIFNSIKIVVVDSEPVYP